MTTATAPADQNLDGVATPEHWQHLAARLQAFADPTRLRLLAALRTRPDQQACVKELTQATGLAQPLVSQHLQILRRALLVHRTRHGSHVWLCQGQLAPPCRSCWAPPRGAAGVTVAGVSPHPSTPRVAFYLLGASAGLAVLALVLAVVDARAGLVSLMLGASLGLGFATGTMVTGVRRQWDRRT